MRHALAFLITIGLALPAAADSTPTPADVAKRVGEFYKDRPDVRCEFLQKVRKPGRRRVLKKSGAVFFKRPGKMRWEYKKPEEIYYISDGDILWSYQREDALVTKLNVKSSELNHQSRYLFGQGDLDKDFQLSMGKPDIEGLYPLLLKPKTSARNFKQLTLHVDAKTGEIRSTVLIDPYDNESTIEFKKVEYREVGVNQFQFTPPAGATIRDLNKKVATPKK